MKSIKQNRSNFCLDSYIFLKANNKKIQPTIKHKPPNGVIGPRIGVIDSRPNKCRVANKYNEPEKNKIPILKLQPAYTIVEELILLAKMVTINNANT